MRRLIAGALILCAGTARAGKKYEGMLIDSTDLAVTLSGPLGVLSSADSYFERSTLAGGRSQVQDIRAGSLEGQYYLSDKDELIGRADSLLVLDEDFGRISAAVAANYGRGREYVSVNTRMSRRGAPQQAPATGKTPKGGFPESFALIRALKSSPKFLVVAADYTLDGSLAAFHVSESSGDWTSGVSQSSQGFKPGDYYASKMDWELAARLGLPKTIDPFAFAADPFKNLPEPALPVERDIALIYSDRAALVDRLIKRGSRIDRSRLWFPPSETEQPLVKLEKKFPFTAGPSR